MGSVKALDSEVELMPSLGVVTATSRIKRTGHRSWLSGTKSCRLSGQLRGTNTPIRTSSIIHRHVLVQTHLFFNFSITANSSKILDLIKG